MSQPEEQGRGGTVYDDPNRESVGLEPAWVEGTGGGEAPVPTAETTEAPPEPEPAPPEPEGEGEDEG